MQEIRPYILLCEAMKDGCHYDERYELKVVIAGQEHYRLDEVITQALKKAGYLFMYSGEQQPIYDYLQSVVQYDQEAIDLCNQLSADNPVAFKEIRLLHSSYQETTAADLLHTTDNKITLLPDQKKIAIWEREWISSALKELLFVAQELSGDEQRLRTYLVIDAMQYTEINGVFNLDQVDDVPIECMFKGQASIALKMTAPYLIDMTLTEDMLNGTSKVPRFHVNYFAKHWETGNGIFIQSTASFAVIYEHLRKFNHIPNEHGKWFYLKYFDNDFLQAILKSLSIGQLKFVFKHTQNIYSLDPNDSLNCHKYSCDITLIEEKSTPIIYGARLQEELKKATYFTQSKQLYKELGINQSEFDAFTTTATKLLWINIDQPHHVLKIYQLITQASDNQQQEIWSYLKEDDYSPGYKIFKIETQMNRMGIL